MNCKIEENSLKLPIGTKFGINQRSLVNKSLNLINGSKQNEFFAIFDENDVDFEIWCDNRECDRGIRMTLNINGCEHSFYISPQELCTLKALETNGRKLHFMSQNCDDGRYLVAQTAHKHRISYQMASINCSKIEFRVDVELSLNKTMQTIEPKYDAIEVIGTKIKLLVRTLTAKTFAINIGLNNDITDLKKIIRDKEGIAVDKQRIIFKGRQLECGRKFADCNVENESIVFLVLRRVCDVQPLTELNNDTATHASHSSNDSYRSGSSQLLIGTLINLFVKHLTGKTTVINIGLDNNISDLKNIIAKQEGIPPNQQLLVFAGKQLKEETKLADYRIENESTLHLVLRLRGGGCYVPPPALIELNDDKTMHASLSANDKTDSYRTGEPNLSDRNCDEPNGSSSSSQLFSGERGVVCYGEPSNEQFDTYSGFIKDWDIEVNSFVIEMRMQSKYTPI